MAHHFLVQRDKERYVQTNRAVFVASLIEPIQDCDIKLDVRFIF